ncbi:MAG: transcription termination/antitermination protein NusG [Pirellulaceae bacterium]
MPILCEETSVFPDSLVDELIFDEEPLFSSRTRHWWVARTKTRQEKALARQLLAFQVPFYLPLVPKENLIRGQCVCSYLPLFEGYLFLYASDNERIQCLTTNRVSYLLPVDEPERLHTDLVQINRLIATGAPLTVEKRLKPSMRVRVKTGPFCGMEGTLLSRRNHSSRLLVSISFLGQGASVEINDFQLEPV